MFPHVSLIVYFLERYDAAHHFLYHIFPEGDADTLAEVAVPLPLCRIIPIFGETCRIGRVVEFLFQLLLEKGFHGPALIVLSVLIKSLGHCLADSVHE